MLMVGHVNFWPHYNQMPGLDWDLQLLPIGPVSRVGGELAIAGYGINRETRHRDEAWALLKFLTRKEVAMEIARRGSISPRRSVAQAQINERRPDDRPRNIAAAYEQIKYAQPIPRHPHFIEIMLQIVQPEVDRMVQGDLAPEEAARRAAAGVNAYLATFRPAAE
jgi:ABC-type glycerol-3-phosphate transport system substrate-binding protein